MPNSPQPTHGLVLDLESLDADATKPHAVILELGAIIVEWTPELPVLAEANLIIRPPGTTSDHDTLWSMTSPVVRDMHSGSGLWQEATLGPDAWNLDEADQAFVVWLRDFAEGQIPLIGSGIGHCDAPLIKRHLPMLQQQLTYWSLDIGPIRRALQLAGRDDCIDLVRDVDGKPHRALGDAQLHLAEARRYLQLFADGMPLPS